MRRLAGGSLDVYEMELRGDEYLHATFLQMDVDLAVDVFAPGRRRLYRIDSPNEAKGPEEIHLVSEEAGRYRFEVRALPGAPAGDYRPLLREVRKPTARDRDRAAADLAFYEAREIAEQPARFWEAVAKYEKAIRLFADVDDRWHQAYSFFRLGRLQLGSGHAREALDLYARAERLFTAVRDLHFMAASRNDIGSSYKDLADFAQASASYERALALARRTGETKEQATILHNLGSLLQANGRPWQALGAFRSALELWRKQDSVPARAGEAETLTGIGWVYASTGQWPRAIEAHRQALLLRERLGDARKQGVSLTQIGAVWLQTDPHRALPYLRRAWALLKQETRSPRDQAAALNGLGLGLRQSGRYREAQAVYRKALDLYGTPADPGGQAITWTNLGWTSVYLEEPDRALDSFARGLRLARETKNPMAEARALLGMAVAERARGNATLAQADAEMSLAIVESLRAAVIRPDLQTSYLAANESAYTLLIRILMERHRREPGGGYDLQALARSEQERARVLFDALRESRELRTDLSAGISSDLLAQRRSVVMLIGALDAQRRRPEATPADAAASEERLAEQLERLSDLDMEIRRQRGRAPRPQPWQSSFEDQRHRLLDPDTVLLEYSLGSPQSYLWLISRDGVQSFVLPARETLEPLLRASHDQLAGAAAAAEPETHPLLTLSRHLLGPVARQIRGKRLLIAADGLQQSIPFAALPSPETPDEPLVLHHETVSIPSLAVLGELRERSAGRKPAPLPLALVGDAVFDRSDERLAATPAAQEGGELQEPFLARLPQSRDEVEAIASLLPAGRLLKALDFAAARDLVTSGRLARYRNLHFATHGVLRLDHPELSALVLSRFDRDAKPRDGSLRVHDVETLDLPADLVVLSACDTALGRETPGEGLVGLPQAFFAAGASRVLVSLWQVEDESTAALMRELYRGLLIGRLPPARALREAQLAIRSQARWRSPRFWAGFVLQGDWR